MDKLIPFQYHLEIYERSFRNDPSFSVSTSNPVPTFTVGDYIEPRGFDRWDKPPGDGETFRVKAVQHIVWDIAKDHVGYKLMVCVETVPFPE